MRFDVNFFLCDACMHFSAVQALMVEVILVRRRTDIQTYGYRNLILYVNPYSLWIANNLICRYNLKEQGSISLFILTLKGGEPAHFSRYSEASR